MKANDVQIGGTHYRSSYQHWDFVRRCLKGRYLEGQITKYIARHAKKNGVEDVEKARHYTLKLIEEAVSGRTHPIFDGDVTHLLGNGGVLDFCIANGLGPLDAEVMRFVSMWSCVEDLRQVVKYIEQIARTDYEGEAGKNYVSQG